MFNHREPAQTDCYFDNEKEGYVAKALEDIPKGAEICTSYGMGKKVSNFDLFMNYGFVYEPNQANEVQLVLNFDGEVHGYKDKLSRLEPQYRV